MIARAWLRRAACAAQLAVFALASSGCYRTHVRSGLPPGDPAPEYHFAWRHGYLWGFVRPEASRDLQMLCPEGWAEIEEQHDLLTGAALLGTLGLYAPRRVTLVCAARTASIIPPKYGYSTPKVHDPAYPALQPGDPPPPPPPEAPGPAAP